MTKSLLSSFPRSSRCPRFPHVLLLTHSFRRNDHPAFSVNSEHFAEVQLLNEMSHPYSLAGQQARSPQPSLLTQLTLPAQLRRYFSSFFVDRFASRGLGHKHDIWIGPGLWCDALGKPESVVQAANWNHDSMYGQWPHLIPAHHFNYQFRIGTMKHPGEYWPSPHDQEELAWHAELAPKFIRQVRRVVRVEWLISVNWVAHYSIVVSPFSRKVEAGATRQSSSRWPRGGRRGRIFREPLDRFGRTIKLPFAKESGTQKNVFTNSDSTRSDHIVFVLVRPGREDQPGHSFVTFYLINRTKLWFYCLL